jgi:hypothetical protein
VADSEGSIFSLINRKNSSKINQSIVTGFHSIELPRRYHSSCGFCNFAILFQFCFVFLLACLGVNNVMWWWTIS